MITIELLESRIAPATIFALDNNGNLLHFDSETPATVQTIPITGLFGLQTLRGIDFRPATGELYGVAATTGAPANSVAFTYVINPTTGAATLVGQTAPPIAGWGDIPAGVDFNPTVDRIRLVNTNDESFRVSPTNGSLTFNDTDLTPAASTDIIAAAYDRNFVGGSATTLYVIDRFNSALGIQGGIDGTPSPNGGVVTDIGFLGVVLAPGSDAGFDIASDTGIAYAALTDFGGVTRLYTINLATGASTLLGAIGTGATQVRALAVELPDVKIVNAKTATFVDADGDRVKITVSRGTLTPDNFLLGAAANGRGILTGITLGGPSFDSANLTVSVRKAGGGDGLVHVGFINALGTDLGNVTLKGDLGRISAGDGIASTPGLGNLSVHSLSKFGLATQGGKGSAQSIISGAMGDLKVATVVGNSRIDVASVGDVKVGGDFFGAIITPGDVASFRVGGDVVGIQLERGYINCQTLGPTSIGGSLIGGTSAFSGLLQAQSMSDVRIRGDLIGGSAFATGGVSSFATISGNTARIDSVRIDGSIIGGHGFISGYIDCLFGGPGTATDGVGKITVGGDLLGGSNISGRISIQGDTGQVTIRGSIVGEGESTGIIIIQGDVGRVSVGRDLIGSKAQNTGTISVSGAIGSVRIGGDLVGGGTDGVTSLNSSGFIIGKAIDSVRIGGSIIAGTNSGIGIITQSGAITATDNLGSVSVGGSLIGNATNPVNIVARSQNPVAGSADLTIGSVSVNGDVEFARILAGFNPTLAPANADASIGKVRVSGDWRASSLVAGAQDSGAGGFGLGDTLQPGGLPEVIARIASVTIKGSVTGSLVTTDHFGFVAEQIDSVKFGGRALTLAVDSTVNDNVLIPFTDDVRVLEVG